jgi:hypothetical protein
VNQKLISKKEEDNDITGLLSMCPERCKNAEECDTKYVSSTRSLPQVFGDEDQPTSYKSNLGKGPSTLTTAC